MHKMKSSFKNNPAGGLRSAVSHPAGRGQRPRGGPGGSLRKLLEFDVFEGLIFGSPLCIQ